jgi:hypothetical protein
MGGGTLLTIEPRPVRGECELGVTLISARPAAIRVFDGDALLAPVDVRVGRAIDEALELEAEGHLPCFQPLIPQWKLRTSSLAPVTVKSSPSFVHEFASLAVI